MELVKQRTFSPSQNNVAPSRSKSLSILNILSNFDTKIIKSNYLALNHYEYLRKEKNLFTKTFSQKKSFVALLNVRGTLTYTSNFMGDSRLKNVPLVCLTETQLSSTTVLRDVSSLYEIIRNDDQFDKFKSLAVLYSKHIFKCLKQDNFDGVIYIKFSTTLCNLSNFSMLVVYI